MAWVPLTLRIDVEQRSALEELSKIEGRPMDQLLNEAIKSYLRGRAQKERSVEANLASLRNHRKRDPRFLRALTAFVEAEAANKDPLEGEVVATPAYDEPAGPVQRKIRDALGG